MKQTDSKRIVCAETAMRRRLGVSDDADLREIKAAFRTKIKMIHPDRTRSNGNSQHWAINQLIEAYAGLSALYTTGKASHTTGGMNQGMDTSISDIFAIGELSLSSTDSRVREAALQALGRSGKRSAFTFIRQSLSDPEQNIVRAAVHATASLCMKQAIGDLGAVFNRGERETKIAVLQALAMMNFCEGSQSVFDFALDDPAYAVRQEALRLLEADDALHLRRRA